MRIVRLCALALTTMATTAAYAATIILFAEHRQPLLITYAIITATVLLLTLLMLIGWTWVMNPRSATSVTTLERAVAPGWVAAPQEHPLAGVARESPAAPVAGSSYDTLGHRHYPDPTQRRCANPRCAQQWPCEVATAQAMRRPRVPQIVAVG